MREPGWSSGVDLREVGLIDWVAGHPPHGEAIQNIEKRF